MPKEITLHECPIAAALGRELIRAHHPALRDATLLYLVTNGKAKCYPKALVPFERYLASGPRRDPAGGADFAVVLNEDHWRLLEHLGGQRAWIDHLLCFPGDVSVTGPQVEAAVTRWYAGELVEIRTARGHFLAGTPNHPVLTDRGWVPLGELQVGGYVVSSGLPERVAAAVDPDEYQVPASIEQVARSGRVPFRLVPQAPEYLDTDVPDGQVEVVGADGELLGWLVAASAQHVAEVSLGRRCVGEVLLLRQGDASERLGGARHAPHGRMGLFQSSLVGDPLLGSLEALALGVTMGPDGYASRGHDPVNHRRAGADRLADSQGRAAALVLADDPGGVQVGAFGLPAVAQATLVQRRSKRHPSRLEAGADRPLIHPVLLRDALERGPGDVMLDQLVEVRRRPFRGHVYNLQTSLQWYIANDIVVHNCHAERVVTNDGTEVWQVNSEHPIAEFPEVVARHGLWLPTLQDFGRQVRQLPLTDGGADAAEPGGLQLVASGPLGAGARERLLEERITDDAAEDLEAFRGRMANAAVDGLLDAAERELHERQAAVGVSE